MNNIESLTIIDNKNASKDKKRLLAIFKYKDNKIKNIKFGLYKSKGTYYDGATQEKKKAYISRHKKLNENWNKIDTPGALSKWILWDKQDIKDIEKFIKNKFNITNVNFNFTKYKIKD